MSIFRISIFLIFLLIPVSVVSSGAVVNTSDQCADVLMLFARGSSSNPNSKYLDEPFREDTFGGEEEVPGAFFRWMEKRITADYQKIDYKAISVHYHPTKGYSQHGYPAVGIFNFETLGNALQAKFSWWKAGEYTDSVTSGSQELVGHIRDNVINCPAQRIVVGGYSQGAHVVHEALKLTNQGERNMIDNVVLFGDPKFLSSDGSPWNPFDVHNMYPWVRGTVGYKEHGLAGAMDPYVPGDMVAKTISWCHEDDFVCTGFSGMSWAASMNSTPDNRLPVIINYEKVFGDGHTRYPVFGVPESTAEVMENLRPYLSQLEAQRGGINPVNNAYQTNYDAGAITNRPVDMIFALNYTSGNEDAQTRYFQKLKDVTKTYKNNFKNLKTGGVVYTDLAGDASIANRSYVAGLMRPMNQLSDNMDNAFKGTVTLSTMPGGGDYPENHGMIIERGGMFASWRPEATKRFVIFAERPAHPSYTFNICSAATINSMPHPGEAPCVSGNQFLTSSRPQWCATIIEVLSADLCAYHGASSSTKLVSRTLNDAITLARAKGFVVDIIQPHTARSNQPGYTPSQVEAQFEAIAEGTGGLYLKYDVFDEPALRDAVWKLLNHIPKVPEVATFVSGSSVNFDSTKPLPVFGQPRLSAVLGTRTALMTQPVHGAESYGWDINGDGQDDLTSSAPTTYHTFNTQTPLITSKAYGGNGGTETLAVRTLPVQYSSAPTQTLYEAGLALPVLGGLDALRSSGDDVVNIVWNIPAGASGTGVVLVCDPLTGILLHTEPVASGMAELAYDGEELSVQYVDYGAEAEPQIVEIRTRQTLISLPVVVPLPQDNSDSDVGQNTDKQVTQDEPNTTENPDSPSIADEPDPAPVTDQPETSGAGGEPVQTTTVPTTAVLGETNVKTNPQDNVGGIEEVNKLFKDEDIGASAPEPEQSNAPIIAGLIAGIVVILALIGGVLVLKKNKSDS